MSTWLERLIKETDDLCDKCNKLAEFIGSEEYAKLDDTDAVLLATQLSAMSAYYGILRMRVAKAT